MPKDHITKFIDFSDQELGDLASMMKKVLLKLAELNADYDIIYQYAPQGEDLHFHIQILPRINRWAGFELGSDIIINTVSPETAAAFYRGEHDE